MNLENIDNLFTNTLRMLSVDMIQKANSGHPGLPLGASPMAYTLFYKQMKHNPADPEWDNRDRFVLSAGHGSALLYSLLHIFEYGVTMEDVKNFRQLGSKTPGHPEFGLTKGVEATSGPLGQGIAQAVGMAMAEARLAAEQRGLPGCRSLYLCARRRRLLAGRRVRRGKLSRRSPRLRQADSAL